MKNYILECLNISPKSKTMSFGRLQETIGAIITVSLSVIKAVAHRSFLYFGLNSKMVQITDLPIEVIARIYGFLPAKDHASMSEVCRIFYEASQIEYIWMHRCVKEFNITHSCSKLSHREIYTKLLYRFGKLVGLWQPEVSSYGGLLEVHFEDGKLIGSELCPPLDTNIKLPLRRKQRFTIELNREQELELKCIGTNQNLHKAEISTIQRDSFAFKCCDVDAHSGRRQGLLNWLEEESLAPINIDPFPQSQELLLMKYLILCQYNYSFKYNRVHLPRKCDNVPIQPGLFKGTYGAHGLEIILLDYEQNYSIAKAIKISGDPNVPSGKVTFLAELDYSMTLRKDEQTSMTRLEALDPVMTRYNARNIQAQPFKVPPDCLERFRDVPSTCIARFHGTGQIAGHGFTNPSFTNGHWIIFDEDLFGFMWLDLLSLSMYHRVQEHLPH